jgi:DNA repair protein RecO (recombination protein O)
MTPRTYTIDGIVLKRSNLGETDRLVTLITQEQGKITCVAKGVRKLNSSKRAYLEPANIVKAHLVRTKGMPLLVQARLLDDASLAKRGLGKIRQLTQILEIYDKLFVEDEIDPRTYRLMLEIRQALIEHKTAKIRSHLGQLLLQLGYPTPDSSKHISVLEYVQEIAERPMKSFEYLQVKNH